MQYCCTEGCAQAGFVNRDGNGSGNILANALLELAERVRLLSTHFLSICSR